MFLGNEYPEMKYAIKEVASRCNVSDEIGLMMLKMAMRYLAGQFKTWLFLTLPKDEGKRKQLGYLEVLTDTDWAGDKATRKSTTCTTAMIGEFLFETHVANQATVGLSSGEVEFVGIGTGARNGLGIQTLLMEAGLEFKLRIRSDSSAARAMVRRQGFNKNTKHMDIKLLFVQDMLKQGKFELGTVGTAVNTADIGTKHFARERFDYLKKKVYRAESVSDLFDGDGSPMVNSIELVTVAISSVAGTLSWREWLVGALGFTIGVGFEKVRNLFCERRSQGQPAPSPSTAVPEQAETEHFDEGADEKEIWLKYLRTELVEHCKQRGLPYSGTKSELADRLIGYDPDYRPATAKQIAYLRDLECRSGTQAGAAAFKSKGAASKRVDELLEVIKKRKKS